MSVNRGIDRLQNDDRSRDLFRAIAMAHRYTQRVQALSLATSLTLAVLGIVARLAYSQSLPAVMIAGAVWAGLYAIVLSPLMSRYQRTSATLQETLDVALFGLPWNGVLVGERPSATEISRLARRFRGKKRRLRDYYVVADIVSPYDVFFCLEQNLAWGSRVRRRYAQSLLAIVIAWCLTAVGINFVTGNSVANLVSVWLVPSLGMLLACSDIARTHLSSTRDRERVLPQVRAALEDHPAPSAASDQTFARQVQDVLFLVRRQQSRTPQWFFELFHNDDEADFAYKKKALEERHGRIRPTGS
ncbi:S-4TM family putative pore-forming effector [Amycolatopsis japonica]